MLTSNDGPTRVWDTESGDLSLHVTTISSGIAHASPIDGSIVGRCTDGTVCIVDGASDDIIRSLGRVNGAFQEARFTPDGTFVIANSTRSLSVWDARTGEPIELEGLKPGTTIGRQICPACRVKGISISADGSRLLVTGGAGVGVWSLVSGRLVRAWDTAADIGRYRLPFPATLSPDGLRATSMNADGTVSIWRVDSERDPTIVDESAVTDVEFSPDGSRLLTTSEDQSGIFWDVDSGDQLGRILGSAGRLWLGRFSPDGSHVLTAGSDLTARLWVVDRGAPLALFRAQPGGSGLSAAFSPDGTELLTGGYRGNVDLWRVDDGTLTREFTAPTFRHDDAFNAAFSADGSVVAATSRYRTVQLWSLESEEPTMTLKFAKGEGPGSPGAPKSLEGAVWSVQFSEDGSTLATANQDGIARIWNAKTGELLLKYEGHSAAVNDLAFSPDGERVLTGSDEGTAQVWRTNDGTTLLTLRGHPEGVNSVAWSPDGKVLATGGYDSVIRLWDASSGHLLQALTGSHGTIMRLDFSPDSRWIATTSDEDGALRIWEVSSGRLVDIHRGDFGSMGFRIDFSPDGREIAVAGFTGPFGTGTGETLLYRCEVCVGIDRLIDLAESRVTRALTAVERARFLHV